MQQDYSSETLQRPATLYIALDDEEGVGAEADHHATARSSVSRAALHLACVNSGAAEMTPNENADDRTIWSKVFNFFVEGLAMGGMSLRPMDDFLKDDRWPEEKQDIQAGNEQDATAMYPVSSSAVAPNWSWWAPSREDAAEIADHLRRERDIKRAVDALSELDDKTLQDIGIPHRSRIEYVVRYCHDC